MWYDVLANIIIKFVYHWLPLLEDIIKALSILPYLLLDPRSKVDADKFIVFSQVVMLVPFHLYVPLLWVFPLVIWVNVSLVAT